MPGQRHARAVATRNNPLPCNCKAGPLSSYPDGALPLTPDTGAEGEATPPAPDLIPLPSPTGHGIAAPCSPQPRGLCLFPVIAVAERGPLSQFAVEPARSHDPSAFFFYLLADSSLRAAAFSFRDPTAKERKKERKASAAASCPVVASSQ
jgi:hypothetical protein